MVKKFYCLFILVFTVSLNAIDTASVNVTLNSNLFQGMPITGTLEITHDESQIVDTSNVTQAGEKVPIALMRNVTISPGNPLMVSIYSFSLPPKNQGSYTLAPINVKIGGKNYQTFPIFYQVQPSVAIPQNGATQNDQLKLEAFVKGPKELYPGQIATLVYRYIYQGSIALTKEELPMFEADGMQMLGRKDIQTYADGNSSVFEISQQIQALKAGEYSWGPSVLEGVVFFEDASGNKRYTNKTLKSEAPIVKITVNPFPDKGKPASFNGAFGNFTVSANLITPATVSVNDPLTFEMIINGKTSNWEVVNVPEICCQPGFAGFFKQNDLPTAGKLEATSKRFTVTIQPLLPVIKNIPPIQFSFFEPDKETYVVVYTNPIPVTVAPLVQINNQERVPLISYETKEKKQDWLKIYADVAPIDRQSVFVLKKGDLKNNLFASWWVLWVPFFSLLLYLFQVGLKPFIDEYLKISNQHSSGLIYLNLQKTKEGTPLYFQLLKDFIHLRLQELHLPKDDPLTIEAEQLIAKIDKMRYLQDINDLDVYKENQSEIKNIPIKLLSIPML